MSLLDKFKSGAKRLASKHLPLVKKPAQPSQVAPEISSKVSVSPAKQRRQRRSRQFLRPESALNSIPKAVLQSARGLAIFQILKAGFVFSGKAGSGHRHRPPPRWLLVRPLLHRNRWPSAGASKSAPTITDFVIVLRTEDAVRAFSQGGNVTVGGNVSATAGPIGTGGAVETALATAPTPMFSYSKSKGLFAGLSLEGTVLIERKDANRDFYGSPVPARDILGGRVPPPEVASRLYEIIEAAEGLDETGLPQEAYIPDATGEHSFSTPMGTEQCRTFRLLWSLSFYSCTQQHGKLY
ncbi:Ysc84 domain-containing protein [Favolaschia claudopus]|uniref:Ysc84 domain-containing protein n=1 Tax=Favolaschia claudopus TaxID=2862362 RepID=A0AAW0DBX9_9AGAR